MRTTIFVSVFVAIALAISFLFVQPVQAQEIIQQSTPTAKAAPTVPGSFIVTFNDNRVTSTAKTLREVNDDKNKFNLDVGWVYTSAFKGYQIENLTGANASQILFEIQRTDRDVKAVTPDTMRFPTQLGSSQILPTGINRIEAETNTNAAYRIDNKLSNPNIDVVVVDSGVTSHADLNVAGRYTFIDSPYIDSCGHGTHVAGTIAAKDNLGGVVGVIPGARIWSMQVFDWDGQQGDPCTGASQATLNAAYDFIADNAATFEVVNLSLGAPDLNDPPENAAIAGMINNGVTVVASAGNDNYSVDWGPKESGSFTQYRPCIISGVICVGAMADFDGLCGAKSLLPPTSRQQDDRDAVFSNWSSKGSVDIYAPGFNILSTWPYPTVAGDTHKVFLPAKLVYASGTSMAAPHITGSAAIAMLNNPAWAPATVEADLENKGYARPLSCSASANDSTGYSAARLFFLERNTRVPSSECVQNVAKPPSLTIDDWCGQYKDNAKMLDLTGYP